MGWVGWGIRKGDGEGGGVHLNWWQRTSWAGRGHYFPLAEPTRHSRPESESPLAVVFLLSLKRESVLVHLPESGKILSLSHIRITCVGHSLEKKRFSEMFFFFFLIPTTVPLLWRKGWGGKMPFVTTTFFIQWTPPPSVNTKKKKKRNRIMHVFLKFAFMITLNFVYYYLCIIEIECTLFFYESTSFHSDIYFMSCKIVPSALPHSENKWLEMKIFLL